MKKNIVADLIVIAALTLGITFLVWLPHLLSLEHFYGLNFSQGFNTIYRNFDGLEYVIISKTWYFPEALKQIPQSLPEKYYAAHFPGYSIIIAAFSPFVGALKSMILVSLGFTILSSWMFYIILREFKLSLHPLLLTTIFLILPARWLIVHTVGSSEPMFIFFVLASIYFLMKYELNKHWRLIYLSALFAMFAQITRPPGILLALSYVCFIIWKILKRIRDDQTPILGKNFFARIFKAIYNYHPLILIFVALFSVFYYFQISFNDFFAYFHSGDNIHLNFPPFQIFNKNQFWVGEIWLEDVIYVLIFGFLGVMYLFKQKLYPMAFFVLVYILATSFVAHRDISRYALPIFPFLLIAFEKVLTSKEFRVVLIIVSLAIYLYTQNFLIHNTGPYPNLESFN